jgi:hypothetical protein
MEYAIHPGITTTMISTGIIPAYRFVKADGSLCGAGALAYGITEAGAEAAGKALAVTLNGEVLIELGGTVAAGAKVESDVSGKAVTLSTGEFAGVVRDAGSAGQKVRIKIA